jgi:hypothetical protein
MGLSILTSTISVCVICITPSVPQASSETRVHLHLITKKGKRPLRRGNHEQTVWISRTIINRLIWSCGCSGVQRRPSAIFPLVGTGSFGTRGTRATGMSSVATILAKACRQSDAQPRPPQDRDRHAAGRFKPPSKLPRQHRFRCASPQTLNVKDLGQRDKPSSTFSPARVLLENHESESSRLDPTGALTYAIRVPSQPQV